MKNTQNQVNTHQHSNKVELLDFGGSDKTHALAAWASTFMELGIEMPKDIKPRVDLLVKYITENSKRASTPEKLLQFLADHKHCSPFRFSFFMFGTTTDIATHIHFLKHTVAMEAENAESARYKEMKEDKFYLPDDWKGIKIQETIYTHLDKPFIEGLEEGDSFTDDWKNALYYFTELGNLLYHSALEELTPKLGKARAKETARFFKPYNSQINSVKKFSFDGFLQIYFKRNLKTKAQREIGHVVEEMLNQIKNIPGNPFEYSIKAFNL